MARTVHIAWGNDFIKTQAREEFSSIPEPSLLAWRQLTGRVGCGSAMSSQLPLPVECRLDQAAFGCSASRIRSAQVPLGLRSGPWLSDACGGETVGTWSGRRTMAEQRHVPRAQAGGGSGFWNRKPEFQVYGKPDLPWFWLHQVTAPKEKQKSKEAAQGAPCLYIRRTIRFGEFVEHPGTIVVMGDVNRGGHVVADGDVIVLGRLLGDAHAGRSGDSNAVIVALSMAPDEIRISDKMAAGPDGEVAPHPEVASLSKDGVICIRPASEQRFDKFNVSEEAIADLLMVGTRRMGRMRSTQRLEKGWTVDKMRRPAQIALFTGCYISILGFATLLFPKKIFGLLFDLHSVSVGWIQVGAILAVVFGVYYIGTALGDVQGMNGADAFYLSTVVGRMFLFFSFCWLVSIGAISPPLLLLGAVNFLGAMLMLNALQNASPRMA